MGTCVSAPLSGRQGTAMCSAGPLYSSSCSIQTQFAVAFCEVHITLHLGTYAEIILSM